MREGMLADIQKKYEETLKNDVIPFWLKYSPDRKYGGYFTCLDRDGSVYGTDKQMWMQARAVWMFSRLYNEFEKKAEYLDFVRVGYEFIRKYGFDSDGRMFFLVTRDGKPLRKRRYLYTENFGVIAFSEYYRATGDEEALSKAIDLYKLIIKYYRTPGLLEPKIIPETRKLKTLAMPMILIATSLEMMNVDSDPLYGEVIDDSVYQIKNHFTKYELKVVLENVGPHGEVYDIPDCRYINPGHSIEASWFLMKVALLKDDDNLLKVALDILDWSLESGWDRKYGGIYYFVDIKGKPLQQLEWDMKLWWPHTEAMYATLLAYCVTKDKKYLSWFDKINSWSFSHFPDPEFGEWFGYLHRDGSVSLKCKGAIWKGPFHLPRFLLFSIQEIERMKAHRVTL